MTIGDKLGQKLSCGRVVGESTSLEGESNEEPWELLYGSQDRFLIHRNREQTDAFTLPAQALFPRCRQFHHSALPRLPVSRKDDPTRDGLNCESFAECFQKTISGKLSQAVNLK